MMKNGNTFEYKVDINAIIANFVNVKKSKRKKTNCAVFHSFTKRLGIQSERKTRKTCLVTNDWDCYVLVNHTVVVEG